jgi:hypothetical protein
VRKKLRRILAANNMKTFETNFTPKKEINMGDLLMNKVAFNSFVYTPLEDALTELNRRWNNIPLRSFVETHLEADIPEVIKGGSKLVYSRHVVTPNYEVRRFLSISDALDMHALFWEYHSDKFTPNNKCKYHLGRMSFYKGMGRNGGSKLEHEFIVDFNMSNGKPISSIKTLWNEFLPDFHHSLFNGKFKGANYDFFDASAWFKRNGPRAKSYYKKFMGFFLCHGILFDNFLFDNSEIEFVKEIFLPAFMHVYATTSYKPLIVALEPTEIEEDEFWLCHPHETQQEVESLVNKRKLC